MESDQNKNPSEEELEQMFEDLIAKYGEEKIEKSLLKNPNLNLSPEIVRKCIKSFSPESSKLIKAARAKATEVRLRSDPSTQLEAGEDIYGARLNTCCSNELPADSSTNTCKLVAAINDSVPSSVVVGSLIGHNDNATNTLSDIELETSSDLQEGSFSTDLHYLPPDAQDAVLLKVKKEALNHIHSEAIHGGSAVGAALVQTGGGKVSSTRWSDLAETIDGSEDSDAEGPDLVILDRDMLHGNSDLVIFKPDLNVGEYVHADNDTLVRTAGDEMRSTDRVRGQLGINKADLKQVSADLDSSSAVVVKNRSDTAENELIMTGDRSVLIEGRATPVAGYFDKTGVEIPPHVQGKKAHASSRTPAARLNACEKVKNSSISPPPIRLSATVASSVKSQGQRVNGEDSELCSKDGDATGRAPANIDAHTTATAGINPTPLCVPVTETISNMYAVCTGQSVAQATKIHGCSDPTSNGSATPMITCSSGAWGNLKVVGGSSEDVAIQGTQVQSVASKKRISADSYEQSGAPPTDHVAVAEQNPPQPACLALSLDASANKPGTTAESEEVTGQQTEQSWASKLCRDTVGKQCLEFVPPTIVNGRAEVHVRSDQFEHAHKKFGHLIVGRFIGRRLPYSLVREACQKTWKPTQPFTMSPQGNKLYIFEFESNEDRQVALDMGSFHIASNVFIVRPWKLFIETEDTEIKSLPIWIILPNYPMELWDKDGFSKVGSAIGVPLFTDKRTEEPRRNSFARLCIEIDTKCKYPSAVPVVVDQNRIISIPVEYNWRPPLCGVCEVFGHSESTCPKKPQQQHNRRNASVWLRKEPPKEGNHLESHECNHTDQEDNMCIQPQLPINKNESHGGDKTPIALELAANKINEIDGSSSIANRADHEEVESPYAGQQWEKPKKRHTFKPNKQIISTDKDKTPNTHPIGTDATPSAHSMPIQQHKNRAATAQRIARNDSNFPPLLSSKVNPHPFDKGKKVNGNSTTL